ncbi:MAG TPA: GNAT family N-acetyltransferase [Bacilli bacterium]|nr:GNAT family N-acetyltransferase [Bacilli bacterium]
MFKKTRDEKKICMIYVCKKYRNQGIGTKIIEQSFNYLETKKPLITLPDYKIEMFKPLIKKYNWQLSEVLDNFYNNRSKELCFNGTLARK